MPRQPTYVVRLVARPGELTPALRKLVLSLDRRTFPNDRRVELDGTYLWLAYTDKGVPVGYAGLQFFPADSHAKLVRAGVLPAHRHRGLHGRMVTARLRHARRLGSRYIVTYTTALNSRSINALTGRGFRAYTPNKTVHERFCFWRKDFITEDGYVC